MTDLGRVALVLDAMAGSRAPLTLGDLVDRTGIPRSALHRILQGLEQQYYVSRQPDRPGYLLGPGLLKFGIDGQLRLMAANRPRMVALARETAESVVVSIFSGREVVQVDEIGSLARLGTTTKVGQRVHLNASATASVLLSQFDDARVLELLPTRLERFTSRTNTDPQSLVTSLRTVRSTGVAFSIEELEEGLCAIATSLPAHLGVPQAAGVVTTLHRLRQNGDRIIAALRGVNPAVDVGAARQHLAQLVP